MPQDCLSRADREGATSGEMSARKLLMPGKGGYIARDPLQQGAVRSMRAGGDAVDRPV